MSELREGLVLGLCNPLLDISTNVDQTFLDKFDLKPNAAILAEDELMAKISGDLDPSKIEYIPGGSAQNTLRTLSWILKFPNCATFMGCTGKDKNAQIMTEKAKEVGLNTAYQVDENTPTGTCAVLITGKDRSLVAHLAAANNFKINHLDDPKNWSIVENAKIYYISGFFFTVCPEAIQRVAKYSLENDRTLMLNLSAPFISQFFTDKVMDAFPYVDIVFGNDDEAKTFGKSVLKLETEDVSEIAKAIANMPKHGSKKRTVIITQGSEPIIFVNDGEVKQIAVPKIEQEKIIDTNGAGDAFVGGFLAQYAKGENLEKCIDCGIWSSGLIIQRSGCTFPETMEYK